MYKDRPELRIFYQCINNHNVAVRNIYHAHNRTISRAQINFMIHCATIKHPFARKEVIDILGLSPRIANHHLQTGILLGLLDRPCRGWYHFTPAGEALAAQVLKQTDEYNSAPFRWK